MVNNRLYVFCLFLFLTGGPVFGQFFSWGQDPASLKWKQINTSNFKLVFPESFEQEASGLANFLEHAYGPVSLSLGHRPRRVPVIIHNQTVVSNGFVSWAPARMELFTNPPPDNDASLWMERLAIHEFRHVVQVDKLNQGLTGTLSKVFGEWVTGVSVGLFMPMWLMEGDAVVAETVFTNSGRGRQPFFEQGLRAQALERGIYSYEKAIFGSYRDYVPNYYELGYQLVASARLEHGADVWDKVIENIARRPHTLFPLRFGMRKYTGRVPSAHYRHTMEQMKARWQQQERDLDYTAYERVSRQNRFFTSYMHPVALDDSTVIVLKRGMDQLPALVAVDLRGTERVLHRPGIMTSSSFTAGNGLVAWSEQRRDPRWEHRSWAEIHTYDTTTGVHRQLSRNTRYFSPAVSPAGDMIAATRVTDQNTNSLVLLETSNGQKILEAAMSGNEFLMTPSWHPGGHYLVLVALDEKGKRIVGFDLTDQSFVTLFQGGQTDLSRPRYLKAGLLAFNAAFSGIDNVYVLDQEDGSVRQLVSSRFGGLDALMIGDELLWSDYNSGGYRLVRTTEEDPAMPLLASVRDLSPRLHEGLAAQETLVLRSRDALQRNYVVEPYSKFANLFNFHSWGPFALDVNNISGEPGLSLFSQNLLSTSALSMGYAWDVNEELGRFYLNYNYSGLYPLFDLTAESGLRRSSYRDEQGQLVPFLWRENSAKIGISAPLTSSSGTYFWGFQPMVRAGFIQVARVADTPAFLRRNTVRTLEYRLFAYRQQRMAQRALLPRFAQIIDLNFRHSPLGGADMGWTASARAIKFLPGLFRHHSLRLSAAGQYFERGIQREQTINYSFPFMLNYPRGITGRRDDRILSFSADYAFPLAYPDWRFFALVYLKRVYVNLFADYAYAGREEKRENQPARILNEELFSVGADLVGNMHLFRLFAPIELGLRTIYHPTEQEFSFQLLFSLSIY